MQRLLALLAVAGVSLLAFIGERRVSSNGGGIFAAVIEGLLSSEASEEKGRRPSLLSFALFRFDGRPLPAVDFVRFVSSHRRKFIK